jgi:hypothetical protein
VADARTYAVTNFARDMLNAADNVRRALESVPAEARETEVELLGLEGRQRVALRGGLRRGGGSALGSLGLVRRRSGTKASLKDEPNRAAPASGEAWFRGPSTWYRPADRRLPVGLGHLRAGEVGDVEHVDRPLAEGRDMGRVKDRPRTFQVAPDLSIDNALSARETVLEISGLDRTSTARSPKVATWAEVMLRLSRPSAEVRSNRRPGPAGDDPPGGDGGVRGRPAPRRPWPPVRDQGLS